MKRAIFLAAALFAVGLTLNLASGQGITSMFPGPGTPASSGGSTTWSPAASNSPPGKSGITLSGGNLTATTTTGNNYVSSTTNRSSGKNQYEITVTTFDSNSFFGIGVANASYTITNNIPGFDSASKSAVCLPHTGNISVNGGSAGTCVTAVAGQIIEVQVDATNNTLAYLQYSGSCGSLTTPVTISIGGGPYYIVTGVQNGSEVYTLNTTGPFTCSIAGASAWN